PYAHGARLPARESSLSSNHVESSPSLRRKRSPPIRRAPTCTDVTRPNVDRTTRTLPGGRPSRRATRFASSAIGPHRWCGERTSNGSSTERRYGTSPKAGHTSRTSAVRPPDVEKKNVVATRPFHISTLFAVCSTARSVRRVSYAIPPYT